MTTYQSQILFSGFFAGKASGFFVLERSCPLTYFMILKRGFEDCEGDPLSPPEGEATQGEHPLDPLNFFRFKREFFICIMKGNCQDNFQSFLKRQNSQQNSSCPAVPRRGPEAGDSRIHEGYQSKMLWSCGYSRMQLSRRIRGIRIFFP
jgi:hypothetical protein